jgi:hypothetical protein
MPSRTDRTSGEVDWPPHLDRTPPRERERTAKFSVTFHDAVQEIERELLSADRVGADDWRLSTAAPHRKDDGMPYANANPDDPSVVVRWSKSGNQYAVACDRYTDWRDNARAIGLYIAEKRKMSDRPVTTGRSEFATAQLPSGDETATPMPADGGTVEMDRESAADVLGVAPDAPERVVTAAYQEQVKAEHPDHGGGGNVDRVRQARDVLLGDDKAGGRDE